MSKTMNALKSAHLTTPPSIAELGRLRGSLTSALGADARKLQSSTLRAIKANPGTAVGASLGVGLLLGAAAMFFGRSRK